MTKTPTIFVPPELRSALCANCGYSLQEISESGKCPECGRECNVSELVFYARDLPPLSPWKEIREYWITSSKDGTSYLRIDDLAHKPGCFINSSIDLPASHAETLHNLLRDHILAARAEADTEQE